MDNHIMSLPRKEYDRLVEELSIYKTNLAELHGKMNNQVIESSVNKIAVVRDNYIANKGIYTGYYKIIEGTDDFTQFLKENYEEPKALLLEAEKTIDELREKISKLKTLARSL